MDRYSIYIQIFQFSRKLIVFYCYRRNRRNGRRIVDEIIELSRRPRSSPIAGFLLSNRALLRYRHDSEFYLNSISRRFICSLFLSGSRFFSDKPYSVASIVIPTHLIVFSISPIPLPHCTHRSISITLQTESNNFSFGCFVFLNFRSSTRYNKYLADNNEVRIWYVIQFHKFCNCCSFSLGYFRKSITFFYCISRVRHLTSSFPFLLP